VFLHQCKVRNHILITKPVLYIIVCMFILYWLNNHQIVCSNINKFWVNSFGYAAIQTPRWLVS
jgi:hypothetical protein